MTIAAKVTARPLDTDREVHPHMPRFERDPQSELVRRYARILRSAPAEATRFASAAPRALRREAAPAPLRHTPAAGDGARVKP